MKYWIVTVSKEYVLKGKEWGIMQVCHGKGAPLKRIKKGDLVVFYSSKQSMEDKEPLQMFTAIAEVLDDVIYQIEQFPGFMPWRRKVRFLRATETFIRPLITDLDFIENKQRWGFPFRYGLLEVSKKDFDCVAIAMQLQR